MNVYMAVAAGCFFLHLLSGIFRTPSIWMSCARLAAIFFTLDGQQLLVVVGPVLCQLISAKC